jgi:hypothetical protein
MIPAEHPRIAPMSAEPGTAGPPAETNPILPSMRAGSLRLPVYTITPYASSNALA